MSLPDGTPAPESPAPQSYAPGVRALADTELLLGGAFAPLTGFLGRADAESVAGTGRLTDGTAWAAPVTLPVPAEVADKVGVGEPLDLEDPEGTPIAQLRVEERWDAAGTTYLAGPVEPRRPAAAGVFRELHRSTADVRAELGGTDPLAVLVDGPLHHDRLAQVRLAAPAGTHVLLLVPTAGDRELPPESLVRLALAARDALPAATVVSLPLARRDPAQGPAADVLLAAHVAARYGATRLLADPVAGEAPVPLVRPAAVVHAGGQWLPATDVPAGTGDRPLSPDEVDELLARGEPLPEWFTPPAVADELRHVRPPLAERGLTVFLTGLSGSGKSTVARALCDALAERADRTLTLLDGDIVRRMLSAGLGFSRADRDRNVLRIGYVAAEVARHGGLAICAPIAPYASTRAAVRDMVEAAGGGFVLVHVATSLEVCEARDRKGLYAKARAGLIQEFTGVSDPYEEPTDAELTLDTGELPVEESVRRIVGYLTAQGWLR